MTTIFFKEINEIRNPFRVNQMPIMARLCRYWFDNIRTRKLKQKAKLARAGFIYLNKLGIQSEGTAAFKRKGSQYQIKFDARNTQFSSLYLKRYSAGYELEISALLDLIIPRKGIFFDVGANFGYFTLYVASHPDFSGKVYSFEPHPNSYCDLIKTIDQSELNDIVYPYCVAAYSKQDVMFIKPSGVRSGNFSLNDASKDQKNVYKVQLARLDTLNCEQPDVLKIDTDGSEADVLKGCTNFFVKSRPHLILESILYQSNPQKTIEPFKFLQKYEYVFFYIGWLEKIDDNGTVILRNEEEIDNNKKKILGLSLFKYEQRFLFAERLNILAINKARLSELRNIFEFQEHTP